MKFLIRKQNFKMHLHKPTMGFPGGVSGKEAVSQCRRRKRHRFNPWIGKILGRRAWQPTPVFFHGESHRQRSLAVIAKRLTQPNWLGMHQALIEKPLVNQTSIYFTYVQIFRSWSWSWGSRSHRQDKKLAGWTEGWVWRLIVKMNSQSMWC